MDQSKSNMGIVLLAVLLTALVVGGAVYFWQKNQTPPIRETMTLPITSPAPSNSQESKTDNKIASVFCTQKPTPTEIGRDVYPIDPKYGNLNFLGQLFTAYNCGQGRVSKIFGVEGDNYTLGSSIRLKGQPSQVLIDTYLSIGFSCYDISSGASCKFDTGAKKIELLKTVKVNDIMKLEPFYEEFEADDCTNCG